MTEIPLDDEMGSEIQQQDNRSGGRIQGENVTIEQGGAAIIDAAGDVTINQGGALAILAGGNISVTEGGAQFMVAGGDVQLQGGGGGLVFTRQAHVEQGTVGVLISRETTFAEGSKVVLNTPQAVALGAAFGLVFAVMGYLFRRMLNR